jgi:hypothetical protein
MRDTDWYDMAEWAGAEAAAQAAAAVFEAGFMSPMCAVCGVTLRITPDGSRPVVCSLTCALELARREELRDPDPDPVDEIEWP